MEQKQYIKKRFSKSNEADLWKEMYQNPASAFHYHMVLRRDQALKDIARLSNQQKILDLGCGAGPLLGPLTDLSHDIVGMDISHDMLVNALDSSTQSVKQPICTQGNTEALPFPDNHFDIVVSLGMFGYVENVIGALQEIRRVLKPDGVFIFSVRNKFHQILFDPCKLFTFVYNKVSRIIMNTFASKQKLNDPKDKDSQKVNNAERGFLIDIFDNPYRVIQNVSDNGFQYIRFEGLGYGPLSICDHDIFSDKASINFSKIIESFLRFTRLHHLTKWTSDVSVYCFKVA